MSRGFSAADLDRIRLRAQIAADVDDAADNVGAGRDDFNDRLNALDLERGNVRPIGGDRTVPVLNALRTFTHLEDEGYVRVVLAVAATTMLDADPLWCLVVGGPSSGKSEALRALDALACSVDEITVAGLLNMTGTGNKKRVGGLLTRIGERGLATISDFSTVLAGDFKERDKLFAALRRVYDGGYTRTLGTLPRPLVWQGRLTLIAAVTGVIDSYSGHSDALGPRWLYVRVPELSAAGKKAATKLAGQHAARKDVLRDAVREAASGAILDAAEFVKSMTAPAKIADEIITTAIVATLARGGVPRSAYGRRDVTGEIVREEPMRLAGQLQQLALGLMALRVEQAEVIKLVRRCGRDSIDQTRRLSLEVLAQGEVLTANALAGRIGSHWQVAAHALEDLELLGLLIGDTADTRRQGAAYRLGGEYVALIQEVFR